MSKWSNKETKHSVNYLELKRLLDTNLKSNSDTEVLINLIEKFGTNILKKIKGMFSIIIYNFVTWLHSKILC